MDFQERLSRLRSFIWWTAPLYGLFLFAGLYTSGFSWTVEVGILVALLAAFGLLDGVALVRLRAIEIRARSEEDLQWSRQRINRLARFLTWSGAGFAVLFAALLVARWAG